MIDTRKINDIIQNVIDTLPEGLKNMPSDVQKNIRAVIQGVFEKMDVVTREEFEVQRAVLLRTREKLEVLESKLNSVIK